jgi:hypothetical protein
MTTPLSPDSANQSFVRPLLVRMILDPDAGVLGVLRGIRLTHGGHAGA